MMYEALEATSLHLPGATVCSSVVRFSPTVTAPSHAGGPPHRLPLLGVKLIAFCICSYRVAMQNAALTS